MWGIAALKKVTVGFLILSGVALLVAFWLVSEPAITARRRRKIAQTPFLPEWRTILRNRVPYFRRLPTNLQLRLKRQINVFIAEKPFVGCNGLVVTDEMRVVVAAQACLLTLSRPGYYYPGVTQILLYPSAFIAVREQADQHGLLTTNQSVLNGESWTHGQVILSWPDVLQGAAIDDDGSNVVMHEFAHQLDQEKGYANGAPSLLNRKRIRNWTSVLSSEFEALQRKASMNEESLFSHYGATNPAEFFAVVSEVFFEQPQLMSEQHPRLFREFKKFYRLNPLVW
jgi:Mlc titration factor MtfA (ptsG expression regulator)